MILCNGCLCRSPPPSPGTPGIDVCKESQKEDREVELVCIGEKNQANHLQTQQAREHAAPAYYAADKSSARSGSDPTEAGLGEHLKVLRPDHFHLSQKDSRERSKNPQAANASLPTILQSTTAPPPPPPPPPLASSCKWPRLPCSSKRCRKGPAMFPKVPPDAR